MIRKKLIVISTLLLTFSNLSIVPEAKSVGPVVVPTPTLRPTISPTSQLSIDVSQLDKRAKILSAYLAQYNSPLQYHAQDFIDASDAYGVDWKLVPSIAGVESTFGKRIPGGYNAWGWGVYGDQAMYFNSWRNGIFTVTEGLRKNYINKGLKDPYSMNNIYAASPSWGFKVSYFLNDLEQFTASYEEREKQSSFHPLAKTVESSAQLATR